MHTALRLPVDAASAAHARRSVEWFAAAMQVDPGLVPLVTTELVSNAVRHGAAPIVLLLRSNGNHVTVEVTDCGAGRVEPRSPEERDLAREGGYGLALVTRVAVEWGVRRHGACCKTVWAMLPARQAEPPLDGTVERADTVVSERGDVERRIAAQERNLAEVERKLARQASEGVLLDLRAAAMHRAAASFHVVAAALHERLAGLADQRTQRLFDRYA